MSLSSIGANISANANKLFTGAKGALIEEGLIKKAKASATNSVAAHELSQGKKLKNLGGKEMTKEYNSTLNSMMEQSPSRSVSTDIHGKTTTTMSATDIASANAATNKYEGRMAGNITPKQQFEDGAKDASRRIGRKVPGKVLGQYYAKPFTDGRVGTGIARGAVTAGAIGGTGYAVTQLTGDYREDYKKNNHSKDY